MKAPVLALLIVLGLAVFVAVGTTYMSSEPRPTPTPAATIPATATFGEAWVVCSGPQSFCDQTAAMEK